MRDAFTLFWRLTEKLPKNHETFYILISQFGTSKILEMSKIAENWNSRNSKNAGYLDSRTFLSFNLSRQKRGKFKLKSSIGQKMREKSNSSNIKKCGKNQIPQISKSAGKFKSLKYRKVRENWNSSNVKKCGKIKILQMSKSAENKILQMSQSAGKFLTFYWTTFLHF